MSKFGDCSEYYTGEDCVNCGRNRVLTYSNGYEICEKCSWCKQLGRYITDDEFYDDTDYEKFWADMRGSAE